MTKQHHVKPGDTILIYRKTSHPILGETSTAVELSYDQILGVLSPEDADLQPTTSAKKERKKYHTTPITSFSKAITNYTSSFDRGSYPRGGVCTLDDLLNGALGAFEALAQGKPSLENTLSYDALFSRKIMDKIYQIEEVSRYVIHGKDGKVHPLKPVGERLLYWIRELKAEWGRLETSADAEAQRIADKNGLKRIDLDKWDIPPEIIDWVTRELAWTYSIIPLESITTEKEKILILATTAPLSPPVIEAIESETGIGRILVVIASKPQLDRALERYYGRGSK